MRAMARAAVVAVTIGLTACVTTHQRPATYGEALEAAAAAAAATYENYYFDPSLNADADVNGALAAAQENGKHVMIILGGDWCHDSIAQA